MSLRAVLVTRVMQVTAAAVAGAVLVGSPLAANELRVSTDEFRSGDASLSIVYQGDRGKNSVDRSLPAPQDRIVVRFTLRPDGGFRFDNGKKTEVLRLLQDGRRKPVVKVLLKRSGSGFKLQVAVLDGSRNTKVKKKLLARFDQWTRFEIEWIAASAPGANDGSIRLGKNDDLNEGSLNGLDNDDQGIDRVQFGQVKKPPTGWFGEIFVDNVEIRTDP